MAMQRLVWGLLVLCLAAASPPRYTRQAELDNYGSNNYDVDNQDVYDNYVGVNEPQFEIGALGPGDYIDHSYDASLEEEEEREKVIYKEEHEERRTAEGREDKKLPITPQLLPSGFGESGTLMGPNAQGEEELRLTPTDTLQISGDMLSSDYTSSGASGDLHSASGSGETLVSIGSGSTGHSGSDIIFISGGEEELNLKLGFGVLNNHDVTDPISLLAGPPDVFASGVPEVPGASGVPEVSGESGASGVPEVSGESGASGVPGESGSSVVLSGPPDVFASGVPEVSEASGVPEVSGESGASGVPEISGESGDSGVLEVSAEPVTSGLLEVSGESGASGVPEVSGESWTSGAPEISGKPGPFGVSGEIETFEASGESGVPEESMETGKSEVSLESGESGSPEDFGVTEAPEVTTEIFIPDLEEEEEILLTTLATPQEGTGGEIGSGVPDIDIFTPGMSTCVLCTCLVGSVYCDDLKLDRVPPLPKETTNFYARYNKISRISKSDFANLNKLKRIDLTSNGISKIDYDAFFGLPALEDLILRVNSIRQLPALPPSMTLIDASHNQLGSTGIQKEAFKDMPGLLYLYLTDNDIDHVPVLLPDSLRSLHLQNNNIQMIHEDTFCNPHDLNYIRSALEDVRLDGNPINLSRTPQAYICLPRIPIGALI
ncbi:collagen alpha-1(XXIV) chain-like isoform X2 [Myxocyprinus asiaticus]|uniref:collagen alpha-1(XXIV) chain-like isoform X2 n=1 Tax=Myxocyprinus asiaticus TaxID=70543 RepID=UPI002223E4A4|nr:collagen alpha-1(XXIV) chain-like isoform X2 [Myxocyprinus asiaticus]